MKPACLRPNTNIHHSLSPNPPNPHPATPVANDPLSAMAAMAAVTDDPLSRMAGETSVQGPCPFSSLFTHHPSLYFFFLTIPSTAEDDDNPLAKALAAATSQTDDMPKLDDSFEPWESKKIGILARYTTNEKLSLTSSFLGGTAGAKGSTVSEKMRNRLEQLEDEESEQVLLDLSQQEYIKRIEMVR